MDSERRYLQRRALFHRRMAREAACLEAECAGGRRGQSALGKRNGS